MSCNTVNSLHRLHVTPWKIGIILLFHNVVKNLSKVLQVEMTESGFELRHSDYMDTPKKHPF
jgi:hypothetical protein